MSWKAPLLVLALSLGACGDDAPTPSSTSPAPAERDPKQPEKAEGAEPDAQRGKEPDAKHTKQPEAKPAKERAKERAAMVQRALVEWGVKDETVIAAMLRCPRHRFVPGHLQRYAYDNRPLSIGYDQTISQPTVVGSMTEELLLTKESKVLEIGTGSGYQAAVLSEITPHVYSIEIKKPLAESALKALRDAGYASVETRLGDGYYGWPEEAPFDAIIVTAASPHVPPPLVKQLKPGGRLVIPVGAPYSRQDLVLVIKDDKGKIHTQSLYAVSFVPLTGSLGETDD